MSFILGGITYYTPNDLAVYSANSIDGVITYVGDVEVKTLKSQFKLTNTDETLIQNGVYPNIGKIEILSSGQILVWNKSTLKISSTGQVQFWTDGNSINTRPPGNNTLIYADNFVQWSMRVYKDNIIDIPPNVANKPLRPRQYTVAGNTRLGFIAEEAPQELVASQYTNGEKESGIDLMAVCALQQAQINALEERIEKLEGAAK